MVGGALQAGTQGSTFIIVARVVTGLGTGALTGERFSIFLALF